MVKISFKTDRIKQEFESGNLDMKLVGIIAWLQAYITMEYPNFGKDLIVTDCFRTEKEQDEIYLNSNDEKLVKKYKKKPWGSVHQYWRGIDIRTSNMPIKMVNKLIEVLNTISYDKKRPSKKTAIYHNLGNGDHIHIQVMH